MNELEKLEEFVQHMREVGNTDLRTVLFAIRELKENPDYDFEIGEE